MEEYDCERCMEDHSPAGCVRDCDERYLVVSHPSDCEEVGCHLYYQGCDYLTKEVCDRDRYADYLKDRIKD